MEKTCFKCGQEKDIDEFYRHKMMSDGRLNKCKTCTRVDVRTNRALKRDYYILYDRKRMNDPKRVGKKNTNSAHHAVSNAICRCKMFKPNFCEICGRFFESKGDIVAHHHDYSRPLDVKWMCRMCHGNVHAKESLPELPYIKTA